eukprot:227433-Hanusia_phi.AAC.5
MRSHAMKARERRWLIPHPRLPTRRQLLLICYVSGSVTGGAVEGKTIEKERTAVDEDSSDAAGGGERGREKLAATCRDCRGQTLPPQALALNHACRSDETISDHLCPRHLNPTQLVRSSSNTSPSSSQALLAYLESDSSCRAEEREKYSHPLPSSHPTARLTPAPKSRRLARAASASRGVRRKGKKEDRRGTKQSRGIDMKEVRGRNALKGRGGRRKEDERQARSSTDRRSGSCDK